MRVKNHLKAEQYFEIVDALANSCFDTATNEYQPQMIDVLGIWYFYSYFVEDENYKNKYDEITEESVIIDSLSEDAEFVKEYNIAIHDLSHPFSFGKVYNTASKLAENKANTFNRLAERFSNSIDKLINSLSSAVTPDIVEKTKEIAKLVADGKLSADAVVEAYGKSNRIEDIANKITRDNITTIGGGKQ